MTMPRMPLFFVGAAHKLDPAQLDTTAPRHRVEHDITDRTAHRKRSPPARGSSSSSSSSSSSRDSSPHFLKHRIIRIWLDFLGRMRVRCDGPYIQRIGSSRAGAHPKAYGRRSPFSRDRVFDAIPDGIHEWQRLDV